MSNSINNKELFKKIEKIANKVDKSGDGNGIINGDEVSIFSKKLSEAGISNNGKELINSYNSNKNYYENKYTLDNTSKFDDVDKMIISRINKDSFLNIRAKSHTANNVITNIKDGLNYIFGTENEDKLTKSTEMINKGNVLEVLNTKYSDGDTMIEAINDDSNQQEMTEYMNNIIKALIDLADSRQIDITSIISASNSDNYIVGADVKDVEIGTSATDKDSVEQVIQALKDKIESSLRLITNKDIANKDTKAVFLQLARQIDSKAGGGNENGYIDGNEIFEFKMASKKLGISANNIIKSYTSKDSTDELTAEENILKSLFDSKENLSNTAKLERENKERTLMVSSAIKNNNEETLNEYINMKSITSDNVEELLENLNNSKEFQDLYAKYEYQTAPATPGAYTYSIKVSGDKNDIGKKLFFNLDDALAKDYVSVIVNALYTKAENNNIDISNIILKSNNGFSTPNGEELSYNNSDKIINEIRKSLKNN